MATTRRTPPTEEELHYEKELKKCRERAWKLDIENDRLDERNIELLKQVRRNEPMDILNEEMCEYGIFGDCPNCNANIPKSNYCQDCGQRLLFDEKQDRKQNTK